MIIENSEIKKYMKNIIKVRVVTKSKVTNMILKVFFEMMLCPFL